MRRNAKLCEFVFCKKPWTVRLVPPEGSKLKPIQLCDEHAAPYENGRKPRKYTERFPHTKIPRSAYNQKP